MADPRPSYKTTDGKSLLGPLDGILRTMTGLDPPGGILRTMTGPGERILLCTLRMRTAQHFFHPCGILHMRTDLGCDVPRKMIAPDVKSRGENRNRSGTLTAPRIETTADSCSVAGSSVGILPAVAGSPLVADNHPVAAGSPPVADNHPATGSHHFGDCRIGGPSGPETVTGRNLPFHHPCPFPFHRHLIELVVHKSWPH